MPPKSDMMTPARKISFIFLERMALPMQPFYRMICTKSESLGKRDLGGIFGFESQAAIFAPVPWLPNSPPLNPTSDPTFQKVPYKLFLVSYLYGVRGHISRC